MTRTAPHPEPSAQHATLADLVHELGDIPLDRILVHPPPGTATEADVLHKIDVEKRSCELVNGTLVEKPMGWYESLLAMLLGQEVLNFTLPRGLGAVTGEAGPLRLAKGLVRLPDGAFVAAAKLRELEQLESILPLAPDLAVEVLSKGNTRREIDLKIKEYFAAGTRLVWVIDPRTRTAQSLTAPDRIQSTAADGILDGADVLPEFAFPLDELFRRADRVGKGEPIQVLTSASPSASRS